jgi:Flp pilus assembly pilin Flp
MFCAENSGMRKPRKLQVTRRSLARRGQTLVEYSVILMLVFLVVVTVLRSIGETTANSMKPANNALANN